MENLPTISVLTCERVEADYVVSTLRQIDREGGRPCERLVFVDGLPDVAERLERRLADAGALDGWRVTSLGARLGSTEATRRVLVEAAKRERDLIFCEDDLLLCRNAVTRMIELPIPETLSRFPGLELSRWRRATNFHGAELDARTLPPPRACAVWRHSEFFSDLVGHSDSNLKPTD